MGKTRHMLCNWGASGEGDTNGKDPIFQSQEPEFNSRDLYMKLARASFYCQICTFPDSAEPNIHINRAINTKQQHFFDIMHKFLL